MIKRKGTASTITLMEQSTKANGTKTTSTAKARKSGPTANVTKESTSSDRKKVKASMLGPTVAPTKANGETTQSTASASTIGLMVEGMRAAS